MCILFSRCLVLLVLAVPGSATSLEDTTCFIQKPPELSLIMKAPGPSDKGLTDWDKSFISDDQSGPFYNGQLKKVSPAPKAVAATSSFPDKEVVVLGLTLCLVAMVFLVAVLLCLISSRGAGVSKMSWDLLSRAVATFSGILIFQASKDLFVYLLAKYSGGPYTLGSGIALLGMFIVVVQIVLFIFRAWPVTMLALGMIGLYASTYACVDAFEIIERLRIFTQSDFFVSASIFLLAVLSIAVLAALLTSERELIDGCLKSSEGCRSWCRCCCCCNFSADDVNSPAWNEWKKQATKCDDQFVAITIGYFVSQAVEYGILRVLPAQSVSFNLRVLLMATALFTMLSMCFAVWTRNLSQTQRSRFSSATLSICLMAAAWCLFHATQWGFNAGVVSQSLGLEPKSFRTSLLIALTLSLVILLCHVLVCVYSLSIHTVHWDDGLLGNFQSLVLALSFVLGVAWVSCFMTGLPQLAAFFPQLGVSATIPAALMLSIVVLPIWGTYVLPRTIMTKPTESLLAGVPPANVTSLPARRIAAPLRVPATIRGITTSGAVSRTSP